MVNGFSPYEHENLVYGKQHESGLPNGFDVWGIQHHGEYAKRVDFLRSGEGVVKTPKRIRFTVGFGIPFDRVIRIIHHCLKKNGMLTEKGGFSLSAPIFVFRTECGDQRGP